MTDEQFDTTAPRRTILGAVGTGALLPVVSGVGQATEKSERKTTPLAENPDIETLREKWFLDFDDDESLPPATRTAGSNLEPYVKADIEPVFDGATFMENWYDTLTEMTEEYPDESQVYHQTLQLGTVPLLGADHPETSAAEVIQQAVDAGVFVSIMTSGDLGGLIGDGSGSGADLVDSELVVADTRMPPTASLHQKVSIFDSPAETYAMVGSADLYATRWGAPPYVPNDPNRPTDEHSHEVVLKLTGPVVRELQKTHLSRWNDPSRDRHRALGDGGPPPMLEDEPIETDDEGSLEVQILFTYAQVPDRGYSWSDEGEFTAWASYLNAIQQATEYVYLECQFFQPAGSPLWAEAGGPYPEMCIFHKLGEALERGVDVLVSTSIQDGGMTPIANQRLKGIRYLSEIAADAPGEFKIAYLSNGEEHVYVHSKIMLVDDEVSFVGSMNTGRRSQSTDGELQLAIIDPENEFTRDLRTALWGTYLGLSEQEASQELADLSDGVEAFKQGVADEQGLLRQHPRDDPPRFSQRKRNAFNNFYDPYSGPPVGDRVPALGANQPRDRTGDGLLEDISGTGDVTVADVQLLYQHLNTPELQENAWAYDFSRSNPDRVTVFDVQALFNRL